MRLSQSIDRDTHSHISPWHVVLYKYCMIPKGSKFISRINSTYDLLDRMMKLGNFQENRSIASVSLPSSHSLLEKCEYSSLDILSIVMICRPS